MSRSAVAGGVGSGDALLGLDGASRGGLAASSKCSTCFRRSCTSVVRSSQFRCACNNCSVMSFKWRPFRNSSICAACVAHNACNSLQRCASRRDDSASLRNRSKSSWPRSQTSCIFANRSRHWWISESCCWHTSRNRTNSAQGSDKQLRNSASSDACCSHFSCIERNSSSGPSSSRCNSWISKACLRHNSCKECTSCCGVAACVRNASISLACCSQSSAN
mmetsp:Transcript_74379/g.215543  ORF Transcript_74379/g.215543 Transcript_74379/m.215543 type:complete len:220 (-) Transcript_74379:899-1558(-)